VLLPSGRSKLAQKLLDTVKCPDGRSTSSGRMMLECLAS
jgi:hypothetical protein